MLIRNRQVGQIPNMKSILVPIGGSASDNVVLDTAHAAARLFNAHLNFIHIRIGPGEAGTHTPHVGFVSAPALTDALEQLQTNADRRSTAAFHHVEDFCARAKIALVDVPTPNVASTVTASWREEENKARDSLVVHARHNNLVVIGRSARPNGLPRDLIETLLINCGRPVLLSRPTAPRGLTGTVMVCWRESVDAARAMSVAMPILTKAARVRLRGS